jgi:hypothetical protein
MKQVLLSIGLLGFESEILQYLKGGLVPSEKVKEIIGDGIGCCNDYTS